MTSSNRLPPFHVQYGAMFSTEDDCWYAVTELVVDNNPPEGETVWTQFTFRNQALAKEFAEKLARVQAGHIQKKLLTWLEKQVTKIDPAGLVTRD